LCKILRHSNQTTSGNAKIVRVTTIDWLLEGDPAIRWQAMRDLTGASPADIAAERVHVAQNGLGFAILARQGSDGAWRRPDKPAWLPTLFTLLLLRATGADPVTPVVEAAIACLETNLGWSDEGCWELRPLQDGANSFFAGEEEPCINGGVLALGAYFGRPTENLAQRLLGEQLEDGGWNCEAPKSRRSSFHTTICVLEGLLEYEHAFGAAPAVTAARQRAEEYLLERALFRRRSSGEVANPEFLQLAFPPRYHYDVLRALDHFAKAYPQGKPDARMDDALDLIESRQQADGRWLLDRAYEEALTVPIDESVGEPSRWNTLRALRVLRWSKGHRLA
jgi:hypothetical protein